MSCPSRCEAFHVPSNVAIVGTIEHRRSLDRLCSIRRCRRRFGFVELLPVLPAPRRGRRVGGVPFGQWLRAVNAAITAPRPDARRPQPADRSCLSARGRRPDPLTAPSLRGSLPRTSSPSSASTATRIGEAMRAILGDGFGRRRRTQDQRRAVPQRPPRRSDGGIASAVPRHRYRGVGATADG